jgi:hypothetical protein
MFRLPSTAVSTVEPEIGTSCEASSWCTPAFISELRGGHMPIPEEFLHLQLGVWHSR